MKKFLSFMSMVLIGSMGTAMAQETVVSDSTAVVEDVTVAAEQEAQASDSTASVAPAVLGFGDLNVELPTTVELVRDDDYGVGIAGMWEYQLNLAFNNSFDPDPLKDGDASGGFEVTGGYNFTEHWLLGASTGYIHDFGGVMGMRAGDCVEWLAAVQCRWNPRKKTSFYIMGRAGIMCSIANDISEVGINSTQSADYKYPNYQYYEFQPGILFRPSKNLDVRLALCYAYARPGKEVKEFKYNTYEEHLMSIKVGISRRLTFGKK